MKLKKKCHYCGHVEVTTRDHFIPKSKGGKIIVQACALCQFTKKEKMPLVWLSYIRSHYGYTAQYTNTVEVTVLKMLEDHGMSGKASYEISQKIKLDYIKSKISKSRDNNK